MSTIKNWPQFGNSMPYSSWASFDTKHLKFVPLSKPCKIHASGYDGYERCTCKEFKFVKRPKSEIKKIEELQEQVRRAAVLKQADEIRKGK